MNATETKSVGGVTPIAVSKENAAQYFQGLGECTIEKIAREAGAIIHVGRRKLYLIHKMQEYLYGISEG